MLLLLGLCLGVGAAALLTLLCGVYTIGPTERGVLVSLGRAQRLEGFTADDPVLGDLLTDEEKGRYNYPNIRVTQPGPSCSMITHSVLPAIVSTRMKPSPSLSANQPGLLLLGLRLTNGTNGIFNLSICC